MDQRSLLVTLTGPDRPGVTSRLFSVLSGFPVHEIEVRGRTRPVCIYVVADAREVRMT